MFLYKFKTILTFLQYWLVRPHHHGHGIHSPFLFDFTQSVLNNRTNPSPLNQVIELRRKLLMDPAVLKVDDFGATSKKLRQTERKIKDVIQYSTSSVKNGKLLYNTISYLRPVNILELGTGLGIGTAFMAMANPGSNIVTIEGSYQLLQSACENFKILNIKNITTVLGDFKIKLPLILNQNDKFDFVYIDGNHRMESTITYFETCLPFLNEPGIIILDDIRWSQEMFHAWKSIIKSNKVTLSLDLFQLGIVFLNQKLKKQQFQIFY